MGGKGRTGRMERTQRKKKKAGRFLTFQPFLRVPPVLPRSGSYLLKVPKNAERLFGSLHFVPSIAPLKLC
jgi:hypothetical protein